MEVDPVRDAAAGVLLRVFEEGAYLSMALDSALRRGEAPGSKRISERGRRFLTQLVYGSVRHRLLSDYVLAARVRQPLEKLPPPILAILRMGVFQALFCRQVTFPAMVHTSVNLARRRGHAGTARLVNAVLRRTPRSLDEVAWPSREAGLAHWLSVRHSLPEWLVEEWIGEFGQETAERLCEASNEEAPVTVRANTLQMMPEDLAAALAKAGYTAEKRTPVPEEVTITSGPPVTRSRLFAEGSLVVQDAASMLPGHLMEPASGDRVLDMCAAPGGKAGHLAQLARGEALVAAMEVHPRKVRLIAETAARLGAPGLCPVVGDGRAAPFAEPFDRVLVDAPCTGLGTLRRHPDLKWRIAPEDKRQLALVQVGLLRSAIDLCKNGGLIVYSVCTFTREETLGVAHTLLRSGDVQPEDGPEWLNTWRIDQGQYRVLPHVEGLDGFFLMRLRKRSSR